MDKVLQVLGVVLALLRHYVSDDVIAAIKKAAQEAISHGEWSQGEKTQFVIDAGRAVVQATPTPWDDFAFEFATFLYLKKYAAKVAAAGQ